MESSENNELQPLVDAISRRRLIEPAIFFLEMSKPLVGCLRELRSMSEPIAQALLGATLAPALKRALRSSDDTERLIQLLESARTNGVV